MGLWDTSDSSFICEWWLMFSNHSSHENLRMACMVVKVLYENLQVKQACFVCNWLSTCEFSQVLWPGRKDFRPVSSASSSQEHRVEKVGNVTEALWAEESKKWNKMKTLQSSEDAVQLKDICIILYTYRYLMNIFGCTLQRDHEIKKDFLAPQSI